MFGELIIMIVYLPILTLEGVEGKLFRPMALTVIFALAGSMVLSLTLMPVLASYLLPKRMEDREPFLIRWIKRLYQPVLHFTMHHKLAVIGFALVPAGRRFRIDRTESGQRVRSQAVRRGHRDQRRATGGNRPRRVHPLQHADGAGPSEGVSRRGGTRLDPHRQCRSGHGSHGNRADATCSSRSRLAASGSEPRRKTNLTTLIQQSMRELPGQRIAMTQPIEMRLNEMISGVRSDVAVKLFGDDFDVLVDKAEDIERVLRSIDGSADVAVEQITGQPVPQIEVKQDELARYGVSAKQVLDLVESFGSLRIGRSIRRATSVPPGCSSARRHSRQSRIDRGDSIANGFRATDSLASDWLTFDHRRTIHYHARVGIPANQHLVKRSWPGHGQFCGRGAAKIEDEVELPSGRYHIEWGGHLNTWSAPASV